MHPLNWVSVLYTSDIGNRRRNKVSETETLYSKTISILWRHANMPIKGNNRNWLWLIIVYALASV